MKKNSDKVTFLYSSLKEAQDNIRTYDTKAQIVGIGFIFTIGMITKSMETNTYNSDIVSVLLMVSFMIIPIVLFASVLYPTRKLAPSILRNRKNVKALYYINSNDIDSVDSFIKQFDDTNFEDELAYELLKVSVLRDLKRKRFVRALFFASVSLLALILLETFWHI